MVHQNLNIALKGVTKLRIKAAYGMLALYLISMLSLIKGWRGPSFSVSGQDVHFTRLHAMSGIEIQVFAVLGLNTPIELKIIVSLVKAVINSSLASEVNSKKYRISTFLSFLNVTNQTNEPMKYLTTLSF